MNANTNMYKTYESKTAWYADQLCYKCNQKDHFIRKCFKQNEQDNESESNAVISIQIQTSACILTISDSEELIICDFRAHVHMFWNRTYFIDLKSTNNVTVDFRSEDLSIQRIDTVHLQFNVNEVINILTLHNIFYTLLIMFNIIFTEFLKNKDFMIIIWKKNSALYESDETKLIILDSQHKFMIFCKTSKKNTSETANINIISETISIKLWHHCLTHVNYATVQKLSAVIKDMMIASSDNIESCDSCLMMKATQKISWQSMIRITKSLKLIHIDLMKSITSIMNDKQYYILFKNDYSEMLRIFSLKLKDQVYEQYIKYKTLMENHLESMIKCLQTDNNIEYDNDQFITALKAFDIQWKSSAAYT